MTCRQADGTYYKAKDIFNPELVERISSFTSDSEDEERETKFPKAPKKDIPYEYQQSLVDTVYSAFQKQNRLAPTAFSWKDVTSIVEQEKEYVVKILEKYGY